MHVRIVKFVLMPWSRISFNFFLHGNAKRRFKNNTEDRFEFTFLVPELLVKNGCVQKTRKRQKTANV